MEDISGLKVADLRRELKDRGLPITGTKIELVTRLQEALTSEKPTSDDSALDDALLDEDSMLAGEDDDDSGGDVTSDTENLASLGIEPTSPTTPTPTSATAGILGSSTLAKTTAPAADAKRNGNAQGIDDGASAAKKIKISREPVQAPVAKPETTTISPPKPSAGGAIITAPAESETSADGLKINIKAPVTAADRSKLRQEKFASGAAPASTDTDKLQQRAAKFGLAAITPSTVMASNTVSAEEQARLAKRKERFGKELTDVQESIEQAKQKRAQRFGGGGGANKKATGAEVDEKKNKRAARFGI